MDINNGYRRLGGKNGLLASRNTSFFAILVVLVIFFALFYMYYAAANESTILQRELDAQSEHIAKLKNEILESNVNLEKSRASETACNNAKQIVDTNFEECSTARDKMKAQITDLESSVSEKEESIKSVKKELADKMEAIEEDTAKKSAMEQAGVGQEAIILKMNETLELMKKDLALKDNIIHDLKSKLGQNNTDEHPPPNNGHETTLSTSNTANNVIAQPNRPDEAGHLSAKDFDTDAKLPPPEEPEPNIREPGKPEADEEPKKSEMEQDNDEPKQAMNQNGEFIGVREPGMRVKMEEAREQENKNDEPGNQLAALAKNDDNDGI